MAYDYKDRVDCTLFDLDYAVKKISSEEDKRRKCFQTDNFGYTRKMDNQMIRTCVFCKECHFSLDCPAYLHNRNVKTLEKLELEEKTNKRLEHSIEDSNKIQGISVQDVAQIVDSPEVFKKDLGLVNIETETLESKVKVEEENVSENETLIYSDSIGETESVGSNEMKKNNDDMKKHLVNRILLELRVVGLNSCVQLEWNLAGEHFSWSRGFYERIKNSFCSTTFIVINNSWHKDLRFTEDASFMDSRIIQHESTSDSREFGIENSGVSQGCKLEVGIIRRFLDAKLTFMDLKIYKTTFKFEPYDCDNGKHQKAYSNHVYSLHFGRLKVRNEELNEEQLLRRKWKD